MLVPESKILLEWEFNGYSYHAHAETYENGDCYIYICKLDDFDMGDVSRYWDMQGDTQVDFVCNVSDIPAYAIEKGYADSKTEFRPSFEVY